jgi:hypothetical protein
MPGLEILERPDVLGLQALRALRHLKLYALPFLQAAEAVGLDRREMNEDILATLAADESVTLGIVKPLDCSLFHILCSKYLSLKFYAEVNRRVLQGRCY